MTRRDDAIALAVFVALCLLVPQRLAAACVFGSTSPSVNICAPTSGATVSSPVQISASAFDSAHPVVAMKIYVDFGSTAAFSVSNTNQLSTTLTLAGGSHHITVSAWDSSGTVFKNGVNFTVSSTTTFSGLIVSPTNLAFDNQVVGTTSTAKKVVVTNKVVVNGIAQTVVILGSTIAPFAASGCGNFVLPGGSCTIAVTFTPTTTGTAIGWLVITAHDALFGRTILATQTVGLSGSGVIAPTCPLSTVNPSVTICTPSNGAAVSSSFQVRAFTTDSHTVTAMKIYLDGVSVYRVTANQINTTISAGAGSHRLTVKAWDSAGAVFSKSIAITVAP